MEALSLLKGKEVKKMSGAKLLLLASVFGLVALSPLPTSADWQIPNGNGFALVDELPGGGPGVSPSELGVKPEAQIMIKGGQHVIWVPKAKAVSKVHALLPAEPGLRPEVLVPIKGGQHVIWVPKRMLTPGAR